MSEDSVFKRLLHRERAARKEAEQLLEQKALELFEVNEQLRKLAKDLDNRVKVRTEELEKNQQLLELALQDAKAADTAKSVFLANMSHEIRTPLNGIIGMNRLVMSESLNPKQEEYAESIRISAESLLHIIEDILDFSKIEANHLEIEEIEFSPLDVLDAVVDILDIKAANNRTEFTVVYDASMPRLLRGDPSRLRQVLLNIAGNAIKFSPEGTVFIKLRSTPKENNECLVEFLVQDTGIGMDEDELSEVFKPFTQADTSIGRRYGGTGLGLAISKKLTDMMGGEIQACSEKGEGSAFLIALPFRTSPGNVVDAPLFMGKDIGSVVTALRQFHRESITSMLELEGLSPQKTVSIEEGLSACQKAAGNGLVLWLISCADLTAQQVENLSLELKGLDNSIFPLLLLPAEWMHGSQMTAAIKSVRWPLSRRLLVRRIGDLLDINGDMLSGKQPDENLEQVDLSAMRILLAEDNHINQQVASATLENLGAQVHLANDGVEALDMLGRYSYDLIFMDVRMPNMDGVETCKRLREMGLKTPVIALTADAMKGDKERFMQAGMNGYLSKPLMEDKLAAVLLEILSGTTGQGFKEYARKSNSSTPVLDIESFLKVLGGDLDMAKSLLSDFKEWGGKLMDAGKLHLESDEFKEATSVYHQLSGAAYSVQAIEIAEAAIELERLMKAGDTGSDRLSQSLEALNKAYQRFIDEEESRNWVI